jgi:hypothetical protein
VSTELGWTQSWDAGGELNRIDYRLEVLKLQCDEMLRRKLEGKGSHTIDSTWI